MGFDTTVIAALIAAVAAIIAPVITTCLNNRHQYKMRKLEISQEEKIKAIQEYTEACSNFLIDGRSAAKSEYYKSYGKIFLYANKKNWSKIEKLHFAIENGPESAASNLLNELCQDLSSDMKI